jgi:hypothetical protein
MKNGLKSTFVFSNVTSIIIFIASFILLTGRMASAVYSNSNFPLGPNPQTTPGVLCGHPDAYRYPEHIAYCNRAVDPELKAEIIRDYDRQFGYHIQTMSRNLFKIDHYIPLCMGGGNDRQNLWPQHQSVYTITDPLEEILCQKMAEGRLHQTDAIRIIKSAKADLKSVDRIIHSLNGFR